MPFEHLPLLQRYNGKARLRGFGSPSPQTLANARANRANHSNALRTSADSVSDQWKTRRAVRESDALPATTDSIPLLLQVDPSLELDALRSMFDFELVSEQEDGYVIVASGDIDLTRFRSVVQEFAGEIHGSGRAAHVHQLFNDPTQENRLSRLLSESLLALWANLGDAEQMLVDVGISCPSTTEIPNVPVRGKRATDAQWAQREHEWSEARTRAYETWDEVKRNRESEVEAFIASYGGEILHLIDGAPFDAAVLPDSFTIRIRMNARGLKDFVLNYPYIFEVTEPDVVVWSPRRPDREAEPAAPVQLIEPMANSPAVCVIDSGIQEGHVLLAPAIDGATSRCFLPNVAADVVSDEVRPGGHGTRVAGAVLYGEDVPPPAPVTLPYWIQNARVLDRDNTMPVEMFPPEVLRKVVEYFHATARRTRIFNHSINANSPCRLRHMSAWAAEIDQLSATHDILIIQSAGNLAIDNPAPNLGIAQHLANGLAYPDYLYEGSARIANPAQSLQALTVGSIAYGTFTDGDLTSFASESAGPSSFSRGGPGIWNVIKPEVAEYGGDNVRDTADPPAIQVGGAIPDACPALVRSTLYPPGPAHSRDDVGTSFAAPKVARIAAELQRLLPEEPALLYRGLIVQSARWPEWAEQLLQDVRGPRADEAERNRRLTAVSKVIRSIGYGVPDLSRATSNDNFRTTFITSGEHSIGAGECHLFQVPIPAELRNQADEFDIRLDVTLSYFAEPRRTRRHLRRYLSTWVDWKSIRLGEDIDSFRLRAIRDEDDTQAARGNPIPWCIGEGSNQGQVRETKRNNGTVQKDWARIKSNTLPEDFCIAVVGHQGWSRDPDSAATYTLAVTISIEGEEIEIYAPLRTAVNELQTELEAAAEVESEVEV